MQLSQAHYHFVGIGGIGMCGLAELLKGIGAKVTGSDLSENGNTLRLKSLGIQVFHEHKASNVEGADVLVYSSAISFENPEMRAARSLGIPMIQRAEALAEVMRLKRGIAIAGTHGKTTTTSLAGSIFLESNMSPTIIVGGRFDRINSTVLHGEGEWLIAEADESDGSFARLSPEIAIITNIDADHLDHFKTFENLQKAFYDFAAKVPFYGLAIVYGDDPEIRELFKNFPKRILFYGFKEENDIRIEGELGAYRLYKDGKLLGECKLPIPGRHNALNAAAVIAAGMVAGLSFEDCCRGLSKFSGVDRRFQFKGEIGGVKVYDDYGHHPTEIRAVLQAFREKYTDSRIVVAFQPHRYSRTQYCWKDFTSCFLEANQLVILDIYAAGELPIDGVTAERLAGEIKHDACKYINPDGILSYLKQELRPGDVFITLGAGDGWKLGLKLLESMDANAS